MRTPAPLFAPISGNELISAQSWREWFSKFTDYYESVLRWTDPYHPEFGKIIPLDKFKKEGLVTYCDGTTINLGSGKGYYRWSGAAWEYIG